MASPVITCPECNKKFKGQENLEGKKIRCPFCKEPFLVPGGDMVKAGSPGKPPAEPAKEKKQKPTPPQPEKIALVDPDDEGTMKNYDLGEFHIKARCPNCAKELLTEKDVVCVHCGYNNLTRTFAEKKIIIETTGREHFMHLLPALCGVLGMLILILIFGFISAVFPTMGVLMFLDSQGLRFMFLAFIAAPMFFGMGTYAFYRLILNPKPKEKEKD